MGIIQRGRLLVEGSAAELRQLATASNLEDVFLALTAREMEAAI
jgi:ABC-type Na+ transport system ATPase subunit NatA